MAASYEPTTRGDKKVAWAKLQQDISSSRNLGRCCSSSGKLFFAL